MALNVIKEIARIEQGQGGDAIVIAVQKVNGDTRLDIRKFVSNDRYTGPTKQGVSLTWDTVNEIKTKGYIEKAIDIMDKDAAPKTKTKKAKKPSK